VRVIANPKKASALAPVVDPQQELFYSYLPNQQFVLQGEEIQANWMVRSLLAA